MLLHPENRIVCHCIMPKIILVEARKIEDDEIHLLDLEMTQKYLREEREVNVLIPTRHMFDSFQDVKNTQKVLDLKVKDLS